MDLEAEEAFVITAGYVTTAPEPAAQDSAPAELAAQDSAPAEPAAQDSAPAELAAQDSAPAEPAAQDSAPAEPAAQDSAPAEPAAQDSAPAELAAQESTPTEPAAQETPSLRSGSSQSTPAEYAHTRAPSLRSEPFMAPSLRSEPFITSSYVVFDTETTGLPRFGRGGLPKTTDRSAYLTARVVSLAWLEARRTDHLCLGSGDGIVRPEGFVIPEEAAKIHGIHTARALAEGRPFGEVIAPFVAALRRSVAVAGHNVDFDVHVLGAELIQRGQKELHDLLLAKPRVCTMRMGKSMLNLTRNPKLGVLYEALFGKPMEGTLHDASVDTLACYRCLAAMAPAAYSASEWRVALEQEAGQSEIYLLLQPSDRQERLPSAKVLFETSLMCASWDELCGLLRGAWAWARRRFPDQTIMGPERIMRGATECSVD